MSTSFSTPNGAKIESEGNDLVLQYKIRLPHTTPNKPPLIILLHGVGSNEEDLFSYANHFSPTAIVVSARAPITLAASSYAWFHVQFLGSKRIINEAEAERSRTMLLEFTDQLIEKYNADTSNVFLVGFSQGAIMSYSVALTNPTKVKGIVVMGGRLLEEVKPLIKPASELVNLRVFIAHGIDDNTMPIQVADSAFNFLSDKIKQLQYKKYPIGHQISSEELSDVVKWIEANK